MALGVFGLVLVAAAYLHASHGSRSAIAVFERAEANSQENDREFNLDGYSPDQSLWSEKAKTKYETAKSTDDIPLALLTIERLNLEVPVFYGTDRVTLNRGIGVVEGTAHPGETGNIGLSGHRDSFFRPLKDIQLGDTIELRTLEGIQHFEVSEITIVDPLDVSVLDSTDTTVLTLITCYPFYYVGYAPDRYIVRATPVIEISGDKRNTMLDAKISAASGI